MRCVPTHSIPPFASRRMLGDAGLTESAAKEPHRKPQGQAADRRLAGQIKQSGKDHALLISSSDGTSHPTVRAARRASVPPPPRWDGLSSGRCGSICLSATWQITSGIATCHASSVARPRRTIQRRSRSCSRARTRLGNGPSSRSRSRSACAAELAALRWEHVDFDERTRLHTRAAGRRESRRAQHRHATRESARQPYGNRGASGHTKKAR